MEKKITTPVVKGLLISLLLIIFGMIIYFANMEANSSIQYLQYIILIGGIIWACTSFAKQSDGNVTFGNIFAHGFKTTAVVICIICVYTALAVYVLFPDLLDKIIEGARESMKKDGKLTDEQIQQALDLTKKFFLPFAIGGIIIFFAIVGAIASAIGAGVAKKNPQNPFNNQMNQ